MDARESLQVSSKQVVLALAFSSDCTRFACGLADGIRAFRSHDCIRTLKEVAPSGKAIVLVALLDDRYVAYVCRGPQADSSANVVHFWDNIAAQKVTQLDLAEPVLGIHISAQVFVVILLDKVLLFHYAVYPESGLVGPAVVSSLYETSPNPFVIYSTCRDRLVVPGLTSGQVQIISFEDQSKKVLRAHASALRQVAISSDGEVLATASKQGTLIRVFSTSSLAQTHEFRRGVDIASIYSIAISPNNRYMATTSDKGTIHIFGLDSPVSPSTKVTRGASFATTSNAPRLAVRTIAGFDAPSTTSSPMMAQHTDETYSPPSDLRHVPPVQGPSTMSAIAKLPGMPRAFSDTRSLTSIKFHLGKEQHSSQSPAESAIPTLQRNRAAQSRYAAPSVPDNLPVRPPRGILAWDPHGDDVKLWCVGGGADPRWEVFTVMDTRDSKGTVRIIRDGYRKFMTRQFPLSDET